MSFRIGFVLIVLLVPPSLHAAAPFAGVDAGRVKTLLRKLDHEDFYVRQQADDALRDLGKAGLSSLKEEMERSRSLEVRWRLRRILHDLTLDERVETLVRQLADGDAPTRDRADWALRQAGSAVVPLLRQELKPGLSAEGRKRVEKIIAELAAARR